MKGYLSRVAAERVRGGHPSPVRALVAAAAVGAVAAGATYRVLRS